MNKVLSVIIFFSIVAVLGGCSENSGKSGGETVAASAAITVVADGEQLARVNGEVVSEPLLAAFARVGTLKMSGERERSAVLSQLNDVVLLAQVAHRDQRHKDQRFVLDMEARRLSTLASEVMSAYLEDHPVSDAAVRARYNQVVAKTGTTEYKLHHILTTTEEEATGILSQIAEGTDFAAIEKEYAQVEGNSRIGDLGWVDPGQIPAEIGVALKTMAVGVVGEEPIKTAYGYHVIYLENKREREPPELDAVADKIRTTLRREVVANYLDELRRAAAISLGSG